MNTKRLLATAAMMAGLATALAATANPAPVSDDFWECAAEHPDSTEFGVCCVFYGGTFDEKTGECWIDHEATVEQLDPGPQTPPKRPVLTRLPDLQAVSVA
jgi:hypothetical protein